MSLNKREIDCEAIEEFELKSSIDKHQHPDVFIVPLDY